jgi:hypothetical protein
VGINSQKGVPNVVDDLCGIGNFVASGVDQWLHDGWDHSCPAGHCHHRVSGPTYSGTKNIVAIWPPAGEGEVFGKESGQQVQKDFAEVYDTFSRKGLVMNHFTIKFTGRSNRCEKEKYRYTLFTLFSSSYTERHLCSLCIDTHT